MSTPQFNKGQQVKVIADHNQFNASAGIIYHVGANNRIQGVISVQLLQDGMCVGSIPQTNLSAK